MTGKFEQFSSARHHLGLFHNVGVSVTYVHSSKDVVDLKQAIFTALSDVIHRHSILSCIVVAEDSVSPYFARLPKIDLEEVVTFIPRREKISADGSNDVQLDELLQEQHNLPFKEKYGKLPFWRLLVTFDPNDKMPSFVGSFIFHHSLGDGASGFIFHRHFLRALNRAALSTDIIIYPPNEQLLPNLELLHPLPIPPSSIATRPTALWSGEKITLPIISKFQSLSISKITTTRFLHACRTQETTVTATLLTLVACSIFENLPSNFTDLTAGIPVNIRHWLPSIVDNESFGVWIDSFSEYYSRSTLQPFSWDEARRTKDTITHYLKSEGQRISVGRFKQCPDMREMFTSRIGTERDSSFDISNIGVISNVEDGKWQVGRTVFSRSAFANGCALSISVATGGNGCIVLGFTWQAGIVNEEFVQSVILGVEREIEGIVVKYRDEI